MILVWVCCLWPTVNIVQLSNRNPYFYQFRCHHPLITQLNHCTTLLQSSFKMKSWLQIWPDFIVYKKFIGSCSISRKEQNPSQNFSYSPSSCFYPTSSTLSENWVVNNLKSSQTLTQLIIVTDNCSTYPYST